MAKIQTPHLANIGSRYGALEADTGVPTVNLKEGVTLVHEAGRNLTFAEGRFLYLTIAQSHAAAGTLESTMDPGGALNIIGEAGGVSARWTRRTEDMWVVAAGAFRAATTGLVFTSARMAFDPGTRGPALSSGTQTIRNVELGFWNRVNSPVYSGGAAFTHGTADLVDIPVPFYVDKSTTGLFRFMSATSGAGTMAIAFWVRVWIGPINTIPPFA